MRRYLISAAALTLVAGGLWVLPAGAAASTACHGQTATIVGTAASEVIHGTSGDDVIVGLGGNDTIDGRGGNDWICGNRGHDRILGNRGKDHLFGGKDWVHVTGEGTTERFGDFLAGGKGSDQLYPGLDTRAADEVIHDSISWESSDHGVQIDTATGVATGQGTDRFVSTNTWIVGSYFADAIEGSSRGDLLSGGKGKDHIRGHGGNDRILTDASTTGGAVDVAEGGDGDDEITAGGGEDVLRGGPGDDIIDDMDAAADRMYGGHGADMLFTQLADVPGVAQVVDGGPGVHDFVDLHTQTINPSTLPSTATWNMTTGWLVFTLDHPVQATVPGFERADLSAWGTTWTVQGTPGPDYLSASGSWGTTFEAAGGNDTFLGSAYDDTFNGGDGSDHSLGMGDGTDTCSSVETIDYPDCEIVIP